jgi:hypothetical protein
VPPALCEMAASCRRRAPPAHDCLSKIIVSHSKRVQIQRVEEMACIRVILLALVMPLLVQESLGKPDICRQHSISAKTQYKIGDTFAFCALKDGHDTFKKFSQNFAQKFITAASSNGKVTRHSCWP